MEEIKVKPSPRVYYLKIILAVIFMTLVLHTLGEIIEMEVFEFMIGVWIIGLLLGVIAYIIAHFKWLEVTEHDVIMRKGVLNVRNVVIPYGQVTNVNVRRTIFDRIMQLGTLEVDTPGTHMTEIIMEYVPKDKLNQIVEMIRERKSALTRRSKNDNQE